MSMVKVKIWELYFVREILKIFSLFLFGFFFLYAVIDYSVHMQDFLKDKKLQIVDMLIYYGYQFIKRANLLLPLALLVSTVKVLTNLSQRHEFMAFQVAGLSFRKLMRPFFLLAGLCTLFNFLSMEFFLPNSLTYLDKFYYEHIKHPHSQKNKESVRSLMLKDGSKLVFGRYDSARDTFFDILWLRSSNEIWKMKHLDCSQDPAVGTYIDLLVRTSDGGFEKKESFAEKSFKEIEWEPSYGRRGYIPLENRRLTELFRMGFQEKSTSYMRMELLTQFYYKCAMPLLPFLAVLAPAPFCVRSSRGAPLFFLYSISLFAYIALFTMMDAAMILGENRLASPAFAIFVPFIASSLPFIWNFMRKR